MAQAHRARARLAGWTGFLLLLATACQRPQADLEHPLGFSLPLGGRFVETDFPDAPGLGTVYYLTGDEVDAPRLTVRVEEALGSVGDRLEELTVAADGSQVLDSEPLPPQHPINSTAAALRQRIAPLPEQLPETVLLVEFRVHRHGDRFFCFTWTQPDGDADWLARWERASAGIVLRDAEGTPADGDRDGRP